MRDDNLTGQLFFYIAAPVMVNYPQETIKQMFFLQELSLACRLFLFGGLQCRCHSNVTEVDMDHYGNNV